jgi:hypothetical protein
MAVTYDPIATTTLGSNASNITFSSISSAYTDLRIVLVVKGDSSTNADLLVQFNSDTANNYSTTALYANGTTTVASYRQVSQPYITACTILFPNLSRGDYRGLGIVDVFSYAGSTRKTLLGTGSNDQAGAGFVSRQVGLWRSTSAINSIKLYPASGTFATGDTATIYGILKA